MVHIDVPKVRGKMAEKGFTITSLANHIGVDRNTLSGYLKTPEKMPYSIVSTLASAICDDAREAESIFFCP